MKKQLYPVVCLTVLYLFALTASAQDCINLTASCTVKESRCASTGEINISAVNGSGTYNYKVSGPVTTSYSSSSQVTGLPAGAYQVTVKDVIGGCIYTVANVVVPGSYQDPRFELTKTDITCLNANNGSVTVSNAQFGRSPYIYTIVAPSVAALGTANSSGVFTNLAPGNYYIRQQDSCGGIQTRNITVVDYNWWIDASTVTKSCSTANVAITLKDVRGSYNTSGTAFTAFSYGVVRTPGDTLWFATRTFSFTLGNLRTVQLVARDGCGNIKVVSWTENNRPSVSGTVSLSNYACSTFTAAVGGQSNLNSPQYCIYDAANTLLACNTSGNFTNLAYGAYCIRITDLCYDTTIVRCFTAARPRPSVAASVTVSNLNCTDARISITGQTNLFNPQYCLYDNTNTLISCNTNGQFNNIPHGAYCIRITSPGCYDTTITRCFNTARPVYTVGNNVNITNRTCTDFTATINGQTNFTTAQYCLFNSANVLINCNNTGVFTNLAYGSYCITTNITASGGGNNCYDTSMTRCFTVTRAIPSVAASVSISNKTCDRFTATITGQSNLINPQYCLYSGSTQVSCNNTGVFNNLSYGSYCIRVANGCGDTTIERCFTVAPVPVSFTATPRLSCTISRTRIQVSFSAGISPYRVEVYNPSNIMVSNFNNVNSTVYAENLPNLPGGQSYRVVVYDACNNNATAAISPAASTLSKQAIITPRCPGGTTPEGSADVELRLNSNLGKFYPKVIRQNGAAVTIPYTVSDVSETRFTFNGLTPGVYIFESTVAASSGCTTSTLDTVTVNPYQYPALQNSSLYQCDNSGFSVGAVVSGGVAPFSYEIIGSQPSAPSIVSPLQANPVFNVNTGTSYSLVRLRTIDGCGNASLNDVSVMPLANMIVSTQNNCLYNNITLRVDTVPNATYTWYKRIYPNDSVQVASTINFNIPMLLPTDTGTYICKVVVNNGCLVRTSYFNLRGECDIFPLALNNTSLMAKKEEGKVQLNWTTLNESGLKEYLVERKKENETDFSVISRVAVTRMNAMQTTNMLLDNSAGNGLNQYRIQSVYKDNRTSFSNIASVAMDPVGEFLVYPNPVTDQLLLLLQNKETKQVIIRISDAAGKNVLTQTVTAGPFEPISVKRPAATNSGIYFVSIEDVRQAKQTVRSLLFK